MGFPSRPVSITDLLTTLIASPDLPEVVRSLPPSHLHQLVREVGVADAGELVALATVPQLVALFDEDLFVSEAPGEREVFDQRRFVTWLEVLSEAGPEAVARRFTQLSPDFVAFALHRMMLVFELDHLHEQMISHVRIGRAVETTLEANLYEEIDGYLLLARAEEGWDALLSLVLALDRDHRDVLERLLDRCVAMTREDVEDLGELEEVLSASQSLAEDVEAEREDRRTRQGFVEPRAARAFLLAASRPSDVSTRDPLTQAYFRDYVGDIANETAHTPNPALAQRIRTLQNSTGPSHSAPRPGTRNPAVPILHGLQKDAPTTFSQRLAELAYLTNVLLAGASVDGGRFDASRASMAVLTTVAYGAELQARLRNPGIERVSRDQLRNVLASTHADRLFRLACADLNARGCFPGREHALVHTPEELAQLLRGLPVAE